MRTAVRHHLVIALGCLVLCGPGRACGPDFPNNLLDRGDEAVMTAPEARFRDELARMKLVPSHFRALPATNAPLATLEAELADLRAALDALKPRRPGGTGSSNNTGRNARKWRCLPRLSTPTTPAWPHPRVACGFATIPLTRLG